MDMSLIVHDVCTRLGLNCEQRLKQPPDLITMHACLIDLLSTREDWMANFHSVTR